MTDIKSTSIDLSDLEPTTRIVSVRESVLVEGIKLTTSSRNETYGEPGINLTCQGELFEVYKRFAENKHTLAHDAAIQLMIAKLARIACGSANHRDNYVDLAVYAAIAFECDS
jgi:hypothetical protein